MQILMCRPDYFGVEYEINPWMDITQNVNHPRALKQWEYLYQTIIHCGAKVMLVDPVKGWPDMVFTANAGLSTQTSIILSHFKYKERQGEVPYFKAWFKQQGLTLENDPANAAFFEGAGDALFAGDTLFAGYGFRTERSFYQIGSLQTYTIIYCELVDPNFYHIDTCFCPLNENLAVWYPAAFSTDSQKRMAETIELIAVNEHEAKRFACNAIVIDQQVILPTGCPELSKILESRGFTVHPCEMDEYLKSGGACKCLTLRIE